MRILLLPIAFLYHIVLTIRHKLYDWRILKSTGFEKPVICVGNLNLGGTGKTPHTEYLINMLKGNYRVATLSRGYGRKTKGFQMADSQSTYESIGDEPLQYSKKFQGIMVAVDEDRVNGTRELLYSPNNADVVLLDDAFQHLRIKAGLNILLTEYQHLYCDDFLFPAGTLRDVKSAARRAHIIVVSKSPQALSEDEKQMIIKELKPTKEQKVFFSTLEYADFAPLNASAGSLDAKTAESALLFCGIANPKPLIDKLKQQFKQVEAITFGDHHAYAEADIHRILDRFENLGNAKKIIVTTEKDAARLANSPYLCQFETAPLYDLPVGVRFHEEEKFNEEILKYVRENTHHG
ncbi:MAG: tetraacyldisaccharide 4'-kinase [Bacteroidales bacterium]|nr:tetraacyldisaccharide 4'-kinase [Bacteroidales bacterium]